jgi:hypothetical protein
MPVESTVSSLDMSGLAFNDTSGSHNLAEKLMKVKINSDNANPNVIFYLYRLYPATFRIFVSDENS